MKPNTRMGLVTRPILQIIVPPYLDRNAWYTIDAKNSVLAGG
ncbi:MAG: hypothetical protein VKL02_09550 [Cylindrospermopsis raciborskii 1523720]|nr:hypothetical protein [Cylindrospermopsis raciborskii]MEB3146366.1 hypothetical protein [Cylindrospermopsis raciborskii]